MPPVQHWATGICRVPVELPDQARACLSLETGDPSWFWEQVVGGNYDLSFWNAVWGLRALWYWSEEFVAVDAAMLAEIRNTLDLYVMDSQGCEEYADEQGVAAPLIMDGYVSECMWCDRCRALVMRDRIDVWLERSGHMGSAYYQAWGRPDPAVDVEADWALVWSGSTYPG